MASNLFWNVHVQKAGEKKIHIASFNDRTDAANYAHQQSRGKYRSAIAGAPHRLIITPVGGGRIFATSQDGYFIVT